MLNFHTHGHTHTPTQTRNTRNQVSATRRVQIIGIPFAPVQPTLIKILNDPGGCDRSVLDIAGYDSYSHRHGTPRSSSSAPRLARDMSLPAADPTHQDTRPRLPAESPRHAHSNPHRANRIVIVRSAALRLRVVVGVGGWVSGGRERERERERIYVTASVDRAIHCSTSATIFKIADKTE